MLLLIRRSHLNELPLKFTVGGKERQARLPTMYWLPKLPKRPYKRPYKARFIANSSSCTTTELSKLLTSCCQISCIMYYERVYENLRNNMFWSIKKSGKIISKLNSQVAKRVSCD